jgi:nucleotide-binding universal stress UspA family protein
MPIPQSLKWAVCLAFVGGTPVAPRLSEEDTMKATKILVPLDGSELAEAAITAALDMAKLDPAGSLILVRAAEARVMPGADPIDAQVQIVDDAEHYLARVKDGLEKRGVKNVETHVWYGPAAPAIMEAVRAYKADLIVMSTHGRSGLGRVVFGSVAESVLRGTTTPILLLRASEAPLEQLPVSKPPREVVR